MIWTHRCRALFWKLLAMRMRLVHAAGLRSAGLRCMSTYRRPSSGLETLLSQLSLERLEDNLFRGQSVDPGWGRVFGGQVLAQALHAAQLTVEEETRAAHSAHSYFLRPGDVNRNVLDCARARAFACARAWRGTL